MLSFVGFALLLFSGPVQSIRNTDEEVVMDLVGEQTGKAQTSSVVDMESDTSIFGPPLEVVEWDLPRDAKPPHKIQKCFDSPKFKVTTNNGFGFSYCPSGHRKHLGEDASKSSLYFSGDDGLTLTYQLMCDGELVNNPLSKFLDRNIGYGFPQFTDAAKCTRVGVTVYRISDYRRSFDMNKPTSVAWTREFGLGETRGWKLKVSPKDDKFGLYLFPPDALAQPITVEFYLLLGGERKAVQRHMDKLTHTFEPGKGGWGYASFGEMPCFNVGVEIVNLSHDGIYHRIQDWEDSKLSKDDERIIHDTIKVSEKAEVYLREQAESVEKTRKEFIEALEKAEAAEKD